MEEDSLGREKRVEGIVEELQEALADPRSSGTFAIVGRWGAGKTWVLNRVIQRLRMDGIWDGEYRSVSTFSPWYYADETALFRGFARLVISESFGQGRKSTRIANWIRGVSTAYARRSLGRLFSLIGPGVSVGLPGVVSVNFSLGASARYATAPEEIRHRIARRLAKQRRQLLVVMDDLDRLEPDELLTLFRLNRLLGDVSGLSFLLCFDEGTLRHVLSQTPLALGSDERARHYLEKVVERRWEVPSLDERQVERLVVERFSSDQQESSDLGSQLDELVHRVISTPRAARRFVEACDAAADGLDGEVFAQDLYLSIFLRTFFPGLWEVVVEERGLLTGQTRGVLSSRPSDRERAEVVLEQMRSATSSLSISNALVDVLREAFPSFDGLIRDDDRVAESPAPRMGNRNYIERYLWLAVPEGAVSEKRLSGALSRPREDSSRELLERYLRDSPQQLLTAIERFVSEPESTVDRPGLFDWFESVMTPDRDVTARDNPFLTINRRIILAASRLVSRMTRAERDRLTIRAMSPRPNQSRPSLIRELLTRTVRDPASRSDSEKTWYERSKRELAEDLARRLRRAGSPVFQSVAYGNLADYYRTASSKDFVGLCSNKIVAETWRAADVASLFVTVSLSSDATRWRFHEGAIVDLGLGFLDFLRKHVDSSEYPTSWAEAEPSWDVGSRRPTGAQAQRVAAYALLNPKSSLAQV